MLNNLLIAWFQKLYHKLFRNGQSVVVLQFGLKWFKKKKYIYIYIYIYMKIERAINQIEALLKSHL